jgi:predicted phage terminase large subunit-like protein
MAVKIRLTIPDRLKSVFDEKRFMTVHASNDDSARDVLLIWLLSRDGEEFVWVSNKPRDAKDALDRLLAAYPKVQRSKISFKSTAGLNGQEYDGCVIEQGDVEDPDLVAWARVHTNGPVRVLKPGVEMQYVAPVDSLNLTLAQRKRLLREVRDGSSCKYDEAELLSSIVRESFYEFVLEFWSTIVPETFIDNWHIKYLCDELQTVCVNVFRGYKKIYDLLINISPGTTKSTLCSIMCPGWIWLKMASARIIGASYAQQLAMELSRKNRDVIQSPKYQSISDVRLKADQNAKSFFMNNHGGMRLGVGTGGVAGFHAHFIFVDDPVDPNKAISEAEIKAANAWMGGTLSQRKVDQTMTPMILVMQRLHENDPTGDLLERAKSGGMSIKHICIPAELTKDVSPVELREYYKDGLMDPVRLPRDVLKEKMATGQFYFAGQFLQSPVPPSGGMFKVDRITIEEPSAKMKTVVRYWDKAATKDDGAYSAGTKVGVDVNGVIWILDCVRGQWESARRENTIKQTAQVDGLDVEIGVEQEPGSGGKESAQGTIRVTLVGYRVFADRPTGDKVYRADPFSVQVNNGNVKMKPGPWNADFLNEMRFFPFSKYKDQVDSASGAFARIAKPKFYAGSMKGLERESA